MCGFTSTGPHRCVVVSAGANLARIRGRTFFLGIKPDWAFRAFVGGNQPRLQRILASRTFAIAKVHLTCHCRKCAGGTIGTVNGYGWFFEWKFALRTTGIMTNVTASNRGWNCIVPSRWTTCTRIASRFRTVIMSVATLASVTCCLTGFWRKCTSPTYFALLIRITTNFIRVSTCRTSSATSCTGCLTRFRWKGTGWTSSFALVIGHQSKLTWIFSFTATKTRLFIDGTGKETRTTKMATGSFIQCVGSRWTTFSCIFILGCQKREKKKKRNRTS